MVKFFLKIFDFLQSRRRLCMGLLIGLTALLMAMTATLKYNENIYDFLPMTGNEQKALSLYQDISGGQCVVSMFKMKDGDSVEEADRLMEAIDTFEQKLLSSPGKRHISEITSQVDFDKLMSVTDFVYQNMPLMLTDSDYVRIEGLLGQPGIADEQLANDIQSIMMPATGFFTSSISNDPLSLFSPIIDRLQAKQSSMPFEIDNGYIFTPGREYAIVRTTSPYGSMESSNNGLLVEYVDSVAQETMKALPDVEVASTGSPVIAVGNASQIKSDSQWAISISITLILLLLVFSFRKVKNLMLIGVAILFGWLFAMGFISVLRSDVSLIVIGIGSIIVGIAVNYPLHFIAHTDHGGTVRDVLKDMVSPLLIGNVTTVGAFASLIPLDAPALRDLGLFAAFMLIGTILFVLMFLPHLVKKRLAAEEERLPFGKVSSMSPENHRWLLWVIFALTLVFGYFSLGTSFDANMHHINYMTDTQKTLLSSLNASAGINDTSNVYIVAEGDTWDEALQQRERYASMLDSMKQAGQVRKYSDATSFICSQDEQQRRIDKWNAFWAQHRDQVTAMIREAAPRFGFSNAAFDDFFAILGKQYEPKPFEYFEPIQTTLLTNSFCSTTGRYSVVDAIDATGTDISQLEQTLRSGIDQENGYVFDFVGMNSSVASSLSDDFNYIGFACGFIVFVFLWLSFGRLELSILSFLPMAFGWVWILGIMYLMGMQFNIVNVILATFIFGQGDDYTIFMTDGLINEFAYKKKLLASYKNSIVISALIMFIGMGSLIVARHPALHSLAEVTIVGMLTVVFMAWIVPPLVFGWLVKNNGQTRRVPVTIELLVRMSYCGTVYIFQLIYGCLLGLIVRLLPGKTGNAWFHRVIHRSMRWDTHYIWGVKSVVHNEFGEDFSRGSIMICNHQSLLDPMYILALDPRILIVIGDKVWRNPIVNTMFRLSRFINVNQSLDTLKSTVAQAVSEGYNVAIFPEGMRTDERIVRFHKGAFYLAEEIGADIVPLYIHGTGHVMPKGSGFASRGQVDIEIGQRIPASQLGTYGETQQLMAQHFHKLYKEHYNEMKQQLETSHYFHDYIIYKYTYKGIGIEKETRRLLKRYDDYSQWIDGFRPAADSNTVTVVNAGRGQFSLLFALVHPELEVNSYAYDPDDVDLAAACDPMPANLHVFLAEGEEKALAQAQGTIINLSDIR